MDEGYGRGDFEYDEEMEADEGMEAADEAVDEADEAADEADEAVDEADEGSDEAWEATDESDEGTDEAVDEADEAFDEAALSASARLRADQDRNRRAQWARKIASDQRREDQRATATQRNITSKINAIQPGGPTKVYTVGPLRGAGVVTAVLPNGRRSRMRIIPTVAPISEVNRLRSVIAVNDRRQAIATGRNSRAIRALVGTQAGALRKLTSEQVKSDKDLRKRMVEGDNRLDKRITKELTGGTGSLDKHGRRMMGLLRRNRQRSIMNSVLLATAAPFYAAYGERARPFAKNNLILTGSLLAWLVGDELVDQFAGKSPVLKGGANFWSYLAPVGNGATAYFLLNKKQHDRFVSGVTEITAAQVAISTTQTFDLTTTTDKIAEGSIPDFKKGDRTVVVTILDGSAATEVQAKVSGGVLTLTVDAEGKFAWVVDTQVDD